MEGKPRMLSGQKPMNRIRDTCSCKVTYTQQNIYYRTIELKCYHLSNSGFRSNVLYHIEEVKF